MKKVLAAFLFIAVQSNAQIDCPSVEAVQKVRVTEAMEGDFSPGLLWFVLAKDKIGTDHLWNISIPLSEHAENTEDAITIGNQTLDNISLLIGGDLEEQEKTCYYVSNNNMVILTMAISKYK